jgi:ATP-dependent helicase/nuclease subunit A
LSKTFTIYRSSAGSGKTRTLAKEYLKLALSLRSHYFKHILAVTFTNKATQEMKDRILAYLNEFANGIPGDLADELKDELKLDALSFQQCAQETQAAILHEYSHFSISTIDAFFQKVIRSFTREAGLTGDYRLEIDQDAVLEEVIDNLVDELGHNQELTDWVVEFARENLENERPWDVRSSLIEFSREIFREEFKVIEDDVVLKTSQTGYFRNLQAQLSEVRNGFVRGIAAHAVAALRVIRAQPWDVNDILYGRQAGLFSFFELAATAKRVKDIKEPSLRVRSFAADAANWPGKKTIYAAEIIRTAREELVPRLVKIIEQYDADITAALSAEAALQNLYVFGLVADISRKLKEYKNENNLMLLADAPKFLNGVIGDSDAPFIYEKVGSFYRNYLIDEFQDTSGLQWSNFLPLLANGMAQGFPSLVVGDVKQAIYRWRGGDLNLLQEKVERNIGNDNLDVKNLSSNFRSAREIVEFNNALFVSSSKIVSAETGHPVPAQAYADVEQQPWRNGEGLVEIKFLTDEQDGPKWKEKALIAVPAYLEQLQEAGVPLRDIAIIVRRNDEGQEVIQHLFDHKTSANARPGMRYDVVSGESLRLDTASTVNLLESAMKYLLNTEDDIARATLAFEFARLFDKDRPLTEVFSVSNQVVFESYLPESFTREKSMLKKLPLFELTETIIGIFKLGQCKGELPYLQAFQNLVLDFYTRERNDLGAFLEWWEINKNKKSLPVSGEVDAAQIITIHKSKGLQFKYVIIPFCSWSVEHDSFKAPQLWVQSEEPMFRDGGYLPVRFGSSLEKTYFSAHYREEFVRCYLDNLNLLYVALTRAESGLIVLAPAPENKGNKNTVGQLLFQSIQSSENLQRDLNPVTGEFRRGGLAKVSPLRSVSLRPSVVLENYKVSQWREKLVIRTTAGIYFDSTTGGRHEKITYGIHLHEILSRIKDETEIKSALQDLEVAGIISLAEKGDVHEQLRLLLQNDKIRSWFSPGWDVRTEVPILLPQGSENRIDRLMIKDRKAIVVDFKTGEPVRADQKQVAEYLDVLRKMNYIEVEGYVLYVRTGEVISVAPPRGRIAKRKDDTQLDLGI